MISLKIYGDTESTENTEYLCDSPIPLCLRGNNLDIFINQLTI
jgi:hypothetical protein